MRHLIIIKSIIETLDFFSLDIAHTFEEHGYDIFVFDFGRAMECMTKLISFCSTDEDVILITFNHIGISGEEIFYRSDSNFWDDNGIICINIEVDHPWYYYRQLKKLPHRYIHYCVDRNHLRYMHRFYPNIEHIGFLPLAGTYWDKCENISWDNRKIDVLFTGNFVSYDRYDEFIDRDGDTQESRFVHDIINDLKINPDNTIESVVERHLIKENGKNICDKELQQFMNALFYIDLYMRNYYREAVVSKIAESDIRVHIIGSGWENIKCSRKDKLVLYSNTDSLGCIEAMHNSKIVLNVMPWFKDGIHDRVPNAMLSGAIALSDKSEYMSQHLENGIEIVNYDLKQLDELPCIINHIIKENNNSKEIAFNGLEKARAGHTWNKRAEQLLREVEDYSE